MRHNRQGAQKLAKKRENNQTRPVDLPQHVFKRKIMQISLLEMMGSKSSLKTE